MVLSQLEFRRDGALSEGGVVTPPSPPRAIPGSYTGASLIANVLVAEFDDHLPLYRQAEIFRREGFDVARESQLATFTPRAWAAARRG